MTQKEKTLLYRRFESSFENLRKIFPAFHRWRLKRRKIQFAMRDFFKMPLFFIDPAFYGIENLFFVFPFSEFFSSLSKLCEKIPQKTSPQRKVLIDVAWLALTLIGRKFLIARRKIEAKRCENSLRG